MAYSRRSVLLQGCAIGAGVIATKLSGMRALAQGQPPIRQSLGDLQLNDPIIQAWQDTVQKLKERTSGPLTWTNLAAIHGTAAGFNKCPHGDWYFLPWHRGYLLMFERIARDITGHQDFALPYWDWTTNRQLPPAFVADTLNGRPNALLESQRDMQPTDSLGDEIVGPDVIGEIMGSTDFEIFGTSRNQAQTSLDPMWITAGGGAQGTLEATPHNLVHNAVGGLMASSQSALDPIFMMHHCNIDRIWAAWNATGNANSTDPLWTGMRFQDHFLQPDGSAFSPAVSDLLTPESLGYSYGLQAPAPVTAALTPQTTPLTEQLRTLFAAPSVRNATGIKTFEASNQAKATPQKPLEIAVRVDPALVAAAARQGAAASGAAMFLLSQRPRPARSRVIAFIREIAVERQAVTQFRVFLNCGYLSQTTPTSDNHYVGTFGIFGEHHDHGRRETSIVLDLTPTLHKLYGTAPVAPEELKVQILPAPLRRTSIEEAGTAAPSRVEISFVSV